MKRRDARQIALQALFEVDLGKGEAEDAIRHVLEDVAEETTPRIVSYVHWLVEGTTAQMVDIDAILTAHLEGWKLQRLARVDLNVLRLAVFELVYELDLDIATVCNEAVELAKHFSTEESGRFVNGVLARVVPALEVLRTSHTLPTALSRSHEQRDM